jgi:hypothetical protein
MIVKGIGNTPFNTEKPCKVTLTGIMILESGSYNDQYWLSSGYAVRPNGDLITKREAEAEKKPGSQKTGKKIVPKGAPEEGAHKIVRNSSYRLNKKEVRHRCLGMFNMMGRSRFIRGQAKRPPLMNFVTITFRAGTSEDHCYQLLNTWLTSLRQEKKLLSYLWIAERQKNGTIHFHMLVPHYLNIVFANRKMMQSICGLVRKGIISDWPLAAAKRYNGVDLAKDRKTKKVVNFAEPHRQKSLQRYITKYVSKNDESFTRQPWHCSRDWAALVKGVTLTREQLRAMLTDHKDCFDRNPLKNEFMKFYRWIKGGAPPKLAEHLADLCYLMLQYVHGTTGYFFDLTLN